MHPWIVFNDFVNYINAFQDRRLYCWGFTIQGCLCFCWRCGDFHLFTLEYQRHRNKWWKEQPASTSECSDNASTYWCAMEHCYSFASKARQWYRFRVIVIVAAKFAAALAQKAMTTPISERNPKGYWSINESENARKMFEEFASARKHNPYDPNFWHSISRADLAQAQVPW